MRNEGSLSKQAAVSERVQVDDIKAIITPAVEGTARDALGQVQVRQTWHLRLEKRLKLNCSFSYRCS